MRCVLRGLAPERPGARPGPRQRPWELTSSHKMSCEFILIFQVFSWGQKNDAESLTRKRLFSFDTFVTTEKVSLQRSSGDGFLQWAMTRLAQCERWVEDSLSHRTAMTSAGARPCPCLPCRAVMWEHWGGEAHTQEAKPQLQTSAQDRVFEECWQCCPTGQSSLKGCKSYGPYTSVCIKTPRNNHKWLLHCISYSTM